MQKKLLLKLCLMACIVVASLSSLKAAPGDTTWVQANNIPKITHYGDYDTLITFPNGNTTYRKVLMIYTLGLYACPSGSQYCHQWDYTVTNYVITPTDTLELGRFITPFATTYPLTWKYRYTFDVTDYYNQLKNAATIKMFYSGYSWGFSCNIKFAFIEGTPPRNVLGVDHLWTGSNSFGDPADPIDNHITVKNFTKPANTVSSELKVSITGHGSDNTTGCCEFNQVEGGHDYYVLLNGSNVATKNVFRGDCAINQIYPQGGTWLPNRGGWCPGGYVDVNTHALPATSNTNSIDMDFENYTGSPGTNGYGSYSTSAAIIHYGAFNNAVDASIENIVAPNKHEDFFRENPSGTKPIIRVKNTGSTAITSIKFQYNVKDSTAAQYTWTGNLASLETTDITLPSLLTLSNMSLAGASGLFQFDVSILTVNGAADGNATNNSFKSTFLAAPTWPSKIIIAMKTNNQKNDGSTGTGISETSWKITDMDGNIFAERSNASTTTQYNDTVAFAITGTYKLTITDGSCDGLRWWYYAAAGSNITTGTFIVKKGIAPISNLPMNGFTYSGSYSADFGCTYSQYFTTTSIPTSLEDLAANQIQTIEAYPNPVQDNLTINVYDTKNINGTIQILNTLGQVVFTDKIITQQFDINTSSFDAGVYSIVYKENATQKLMQKKFVVIK